MIECDRNDINQWRYRKDTTVPLNAIFCAKCPEVFPIGRKDRIVPEESPIGSYKRQAKTSVKVRRVPKYDVCQSAVAGGCFNMGDIENAGFH
uniref:Uncharacterized protein n=1 Tax=Romanomermis culicivorax TaxID=13658 RepID=A0A915KQU6_ROMCU